MISMSASGLALRAVRTYEKLYNMKKLYSTNENDNVEKSLNENVVCQINSLSDYIAKIWPRFARPFSLRLSYYIAFSDFRSRSTYADADMEINCVCPNCNYPLLNLARRRRENFELL